MARTSVAGRIKFPNNDPTFTLELPAKWTFEDDKDGNLNCYPNDDSGYVFTIMALEHINSQKELKEALPDLAKSGGEGGKVKDFQLGKIETSKNDNGVSFMGVTGDGKVEGEGFLIVVHGFEAPKGKFYAIVTAGSEKADSKHTKNYDAIFDSIEPLE
jgi:hypothetical protein